VGGVDAEDDVDGDDGDEEIGCGKDVDVERPGEAPLVVRFIPVGTGLRPGCWLFIVVIFTWSMIFSLC
jgi:hypothetical protein